MFSRFDGNLIKPADFLMLLAARSAGRVTGRDSHNTNEAACSQWGKLCRVPATEIIEPFYGWRGVG